MKEIEKSINIVNRLLIEEVGLFMAVGTAQVLKFKTLDSLPVELMTLVENQCLMVAALGFGQDAANDAFRQDVLAHLRQGELYVAFDSEGAVAFRLIQQPRPDTLYLAGAVKISRGPKHLVREITATILEERQPKYVVTRTQNDQVVDMMMEYGHGLVVPINSLINEEVMTILSDCGLLSERVDLQNLVVRGHYGRSMIGRNERPASHNSSVYRRMRELIPDEAYYQGDAVLLVAGRNEMGR